MELIQVKHYLNALVYFEDRQINFSKDSTNEYILTACILRKDKQGRFYYQAELKDLKANSVCIVPLEKVKVTTFSN